VRARPKHRLHLYRRARRITALLLGCEVGCFVVAFALLRAPTGGWPGATVEPARALLPRLAADRGALTAGWVAALLAAGLLLPIAVLLRHLIGSRRGPLLEIAVGFSAVALSLQLMAIGCWLLVLPGLADGYAAASPDGAAGGPALAGGVSQADLLLVADTIVAAADAGGRVGGFFTAVWVWFLGGMMVPSGRLPRWPGRLGVMFALLLIVAVATGAAAPRLAAALALQGWFVLLIGVVLRQAATASAATANAAEAAAIDAAVAD
jgi:Domain of unknown function (DUF4386)